MNQKDFGFTKRLMLGVMVGSIGLMGQVAQAEIGPGLLLSPWEEGIELETSNSLFVISDNETGQGEDIDMSLFVSSARGKLDRFGHPNINVGYRASTLQIDTDQVGIPSTLNNIAVAMSYDFGQITDQWSLGYTVGMGTSNDGDFQNESSYYGMATVAGTYAIDPQRMITFGISYDGNRTILPDTPLPFVQYFHYVSPELQYMLGLYSQVTWRPTENIKIVAGSGLFPGGQVIGADARISWMINEDIELFTAFDQMTDGYYVKDHMGDDRDNRRIFMMYNMASVGAKFDVNDRVHIEGGVGYAFNQKLSKGFDARSLDVIAKPDDHAVFFMNVKADF